MEELCRYYYEDYGFETRVVRFHNVYGTLGTYEGGKEKAPAAICRKVASTPEGGEIEVWGDGEQTRSFLYVDDCVDGIYRIMRSDYPHPLNLGSDELVTINQLVDLVADIAESASASGTTSPSPRGKGAEQRQHQLRRVLGWEPRISLKEGLVPTYRWIESELGQVRETAQLTTAV
jgi:nucleoside-diphosphate-sugar epimerase